MEETIYEPFILFIYLFKHLLFEKGLIFSFRKFIGKSAFFLLYSVNVQSTPLKSAVCFIAKELFLLILFSLRIGTLKKVLIIFFNSVKILKYVFYASEKRFFKKLKKEYFIKVVKIRKSGIYRRFFILAEFALGHRIMQFLQSFQKYFFFAIFLHMVYPIHTKLKKLQNHEKFTIFINWF